jgi:hypothetical protein
MANDRAEMGDVEDRIVQLMLAFAQGAGTHLMSIAAIRAARDQYEDLIRDYGDDWYAALPAAVFFSRALGSAAAHLAASEGGQFIEPSHFAEASRRTSIRPLIDCPFCRQKFINPPGQ